MSTMTLVELERRIVDGSSERLFLDTDRGVTEYHSCGNRHGKRFWKVECGSYWLVRESGIRLEWQRVDTSRANNQPIVTLYPRRTHKLPKPIMALFEIPDAAVPDGFHERA
ncbi:MAG: hypothetical protein HY470_00690 [Candidatus Ryanbacteria bacterium]|nr:hypothetical protein [Candidatus Ryanbacteria bacterium]